MADYPWRRARCIHCAADQTVYHGGAHVIDGIYTQCTAPTAEEYIAELEGKLATAQQCAERRKRHANAMDKRAIEATQQLVEARKLAAVLQETIDDHKDTDATAWLQAHDAEVIEKAAKAAYDWLILTGLDGEADRVRNVIHALKESR